MSLWYSSRKRIVVAAVLAGALLYSNYYIVIDHGEAVQQKFVSCLVLFSIYSISKKHLIDVANHILILKGCNFAS